MYSSIAHLIFVSLWSNYVWAAVSNASEISGGRETSLRGRNESLKLKSVGFPLPQPMSMASSLEMGAKEKPLLDNATMQNISTVYSNSSLVMMNTLTFADSTPAEPPSLPPCTSEESGANPWGCGLRTGTVNIHSAALALGPIADRITTFTGKVQLSADQKRVVDGVGKIAKNLGPLLMKVSAATGPAAPWVFLGGAVITGVGGIMEGIFTGPAQPSQPSLKDFIQAGFDKIGMKLDAFEHRLYVLEQDMQVAITHLKDIKDITLKTLLQKDNQFYFTVGHAYDSFNRLVSHKESKELVYLDQIGAGLDADLLQFRASMKSNFQLVVQHEGMGAAALRFHRTMTARLQAHMLVWTYRIMRRQYVLAAILQENLVKDLGEYKKLVDDFMLQHWLNLDLSPLSNSNHKTHSKHLDFWVSVAKNQAWDRVKGILSTHCSGQCSRHPKPDDCLRDARVLREDGNVCAVANGVGQLRELLRCGDACGVAANAIGKLITSAGIGKESVPYLRAIKKEDCLVCVDGKNKCFPPGQYSLRALETKGVRDNQMRNIEVSGRGCKAVVYEHPDKKGWRITYNEGSRSVRQGVSAMDVERDAEMNCYYQAQLALFRMGQASEPPPLVPPPPAPVTPWCFCRYKCRFDPREDNRLSHVPPHEPYCNSDIFKRYKPHRLCIFGFYSIWDCYWKA